LFLRNQNDIYNQTTILPAQDVPKKKDKIYKSISTTKIKN